ncbi:MAG: YeeE/YedE family protein [Chitinophagales bacterium]|nr:YeeE/YedE family protein [Chitinophagales bacterium]
MRLLKFLLLGIFFGIVLAKAQVISWFRIYEMFRFESFHMYGIIGSAVVLGVFIVQYIKRSHLKAIDDTPISIQPKPTTYKASIFGGILFGLGWALVGACPGPIYILIGAGFWSFILVLIGALLGTFIYGVLKEKLPH